MTRALFQKYLDHQCTPAEGREVEQWLRNCSTEELDNLLRDSWEEAPVAMPAARATALWENLRRHITATGPAGRIIPMRSICRLAIAVAAAVLLVFAGLQWLHTEKTTAAQVTVKQMASAPALTADDWLNIVNNDSIKIRLVLTDGTEVLLSRYSSLKWRRHFETNRRDLYLEGRAQFAVAKDSRRPFTVHSDALATTALGTVFIVDARGRQPYISVRLLDGRILVRVEQH
ncbi:MAG: FecR domain-containing protein, partial [Bacteroidetes bacterium]|nr:FecR domain-containing protein [Bacteroidota bacterium]